MEAADVKEYLGCLKSSGSDMAPQVVQFITQAAMKAGAGESVSQNCEELIEKEDDGCDQSYGQNLKGLTGVETDLTAGDLCVKTCSQEEEGEDSEGGGKAGAGHHHGHKHGGGHKHEPSCAKQFQIVEKVTGGALEADDVQGYLGCLKSSKRDMIPPVVQFITGAAVKAGAGETVSNDCKELIETEDNGCDEPYGKKMKGLTGVEGDLKAGDLCPKTCSKEEEDGEGEEEEGEGEAADAAEEEKGEGEAAEAAEEEEGEGEAAEAAEEEAAERKYQLLPMVAFEKMSSTMVGATAAALLATALAVAGLVVRVLRRKSALAETAVDDALVEFLPVE